MPKLLVVGGKGTIGRLVVERMAGDHEIVTAGRSGGDVRVDLSDASSIAAMLGKIGKVDAVVCAAGQTQFAPLEAMPEDALRSAMEHKLIGQVNLVRLGVQHINDSGTIVLTSGCTNIQPVRNGSISGLVNGGLDGFVVSAAVDLPRGIRINCVSPGLLKESGGKSGHKFPGFKQVEGLDVARAYHRCIATGMTGKVIYVH